MTNKGDPNKFYIVFHWFLDRAGKSPLSVGYVASNNDGVTTLSWIEDFWDPTVQYLKLSQRSWKICVAGDHRCDGLAMAGYSLQPCSVDLTDSGILLFVETNSGILLLCGGKEHRTAAGRRQKANTTYILACVCLSPELQLQWLTWLRLQRFPATET